MKNTNTRGGIKSMYGFHIGQIVKSAVDMLDERGVIVKAGASLRIVAIASKVHATSRFLVQQYPTTFDTKEYFPNLVRAEQDNDYASRLRPNFVTIRKV